MTFMDRIYLSTYIVFVFKSICFMCLPGVGDVTACSVSRCFQATFAQTFLSPQVYTLSPVIPENLLICHESSTHWLTFG